jgi:integrase
MKEIVEAVEQKQHQRRRSRAQRGSIIKRGESWTIVYRTPDAKQKWEGGFEKKDRAQARLDEVLGAIRANKYVPRTDETLREYCDASMETAKHTVKPKTWVGMESVLRKWLYPAFGDWPISSINRQAVTKFRDDLIANPKIGPKSVKTIVSTLHRFLEEALDAGIISANPAHKMKMQRHDADEVVIPKDAEIFKVLAKLPAVYQHLVIAGAFTGARRGELLGLRWEDVDLESGSISVSKNLQRVSKKLLDGGTFRNVERLGDTGLVLLTPKTKKSRRMVEAGPELTSLLRRMSEERAGSAFVFHDELGAPIDPDRATKMVRLARKKAGVAFHLHLLRHVHSSLLVEAGANIKQAQARLGHANAATTADIYTHVVTNKGKKLSKRVERALPSVSLLLANERTNGPVN